MQHLPSLTPTLSVAVFRYEGGLPPAPALAAEPMSAGTLRTPTTLAAANTPALAPPAWQMFDWSSCAVTQAAVVSARDCGGAAAALVPWTIEGSPAGPQDAGRAVAVLHPVYLTGDVPSTLTDRRAQFSGVGIAISSLQEWRRAGGSGPDNTRGRQGAELQVRLTTAGNPGTGTVATSSPGFGRSSADFGASTQFGLFSPSPDETECALAAAAPGVGDSFTVFLESSDDFTSERLVDATALLAMGLILLLALVVAVAYGTRHWHARKRLHIAIGQHEVRVVLQQAGCVVCVCVCVCVCGVWCVCVAARGTALTRAFRWCHGSWATKNRAILPASRPPQARRHAMA